jgi:hypothetical protein
MTFRQESRLRRHLAPLVHDNSGPWRPLLRSEEHRHVSPQSFRAPCAIQS